MRQCVRGLERILQSGMQTDPAGCQVEEKEDEEGGDDRIERAIELFNKLAHTHGHTITKALHERQRERTRTDKQTGKGGYALFGRGHGVGFVQVRQDLQESSPQLLERWARGRVPAQHNTNNAQRRQRDRQQNKKSLLTSQKEQK
jgi:hypothetical protein